MPGHILSDVRADLLGKTMWGLGICFIVGTFADITVDQRPLFGVVAGLISIGLLVGVVALSPVPAARAWLAMAIVAAVVWETCAVLPWLTRLDAAGLRSSSEGVALVGAGFYSLAMAAWFRGEWPVAARRFLVAARASLAVGSVALLVMIGLMITTDPRHVPVGDGASSGTLFGRPWPGGPVAGLIGALFGVAAIGSLVLLHRANGFTSKSLEKMDGVRAPSSIPVP